MQLFSAGATRGIDKARQNVRTRLSTIVATESPLDFMATVCQI